jgi:hypothetical protein
MTPPRRNIPSRGRGQLIRRKPVPATDLAQQYATRINRAMSSAVNGILDMGRAFHEAKGKLHHGGWLRMFADHAEPIAEPVWCSKGTAERLMKIATHSVLSNAAHVPNLPPTWGTLYELTKVARPRLLEAIKRGEIHPDMQRRDVSKLRVLEARTVPRAESFLPPPTPGEQLLRDIVRQLQLRFVYLDPHERMKVLTQSRHYLDDLEQNDDDLKPQQHAAPPSIDTPARIGKLTPASSAAVRSYIQRLETLLSYARSDLDGDAWNRFVTDARAIFENLTVQA